MLNNLKWESLESRREQFSVIMLYNILKQNTYQPLDYLPELQSSQYQLQIRSRHIITLREHFCNTDAFKYSFLTLSPRLWNSLSRWIVECSTTESFKLAQQNYLYGLNN